MNRFKIKADKYNLCKGKIMLFLEDNQLSLESKGLLVYLLSFDNNTCIEERDILDHTKDSEETVKRALDELVSARYIEKV